MGLREVCDPSKAALLLVDLQNDFCHPEGAYGRRGRDMRAIQAMIPRLKRLAEDAREAGVQLIFVRTTHDETTSSPAWLAFKNRDGAEKAPSCVTGTWGAEFYELSPQPGDIVVTKHRYSAFIGTNLEQVLRSKGRDRLIITGVATNVCVESTARDGFMRDYPVVLVSDCTATSSAAAQAATEENISKHFGWVARVDDIVKAWGAS